MNNPAGATGEDKAAAEPVAKKTKVFSSPPKPWYIGVSPPCLHLVSWHMRGLFNFFSAGETNLQVCFAT